MFCLLGLRVEKEGTYGSIHHHAADRSRITDRCYYPDSS